jgi:hypothetical protein
MEVANGNPRANSLPAGISEGQLADLVSRSGYPLQCVVAQFLQPDFLVQQEWGYVDRDTRQLRTLDVLAWRWLFEWDDPQPRIRPTLDLLIECKQSALPYVFFVASSGPVPLHFPLLAGLANNQEIAISTDDDPSVWRLPILQCLGLEDQPFLAQPVPCCTVFARCEGKQESKGLELSGAEPFSGLVLPLVKGLVDFQRRQAPPRTAVHFDCHIVFAIAVLDAPMVVANLGEELTLAPWVRVLRHEAAPQPIHRQHDHERLFVIDVVHKEFFQQYLQSFVIPFAELFANRALKHQVELAQGKGFAAGMGTDSWSNLEDRIRPSTGRAQLARAKAIARNVGKALRNLATRG